MNLSLIFDDINVDYYLTMIHPDGGISGPTRILMIDSDRQGLAHLRKTKKHYPNCKLILEKQGQSGSHVKIAEL